MLRLPYAIAPTTRRGWFVTIHFISLPEGCRVYRRCTADIGWGPGTVARYLCALLIGSVCTVSAHAGPGDFPHWDGQSCATCHGEEKPTAIENFDDDAMCGKCHDRSDTLSCRHPSNIAVGNTDSVSLPDDFRSAIRGGQVVCTTCHDPLVQCQGDKLAPYLNPRFLRGGEFRRPDEACLQCHEKAAYPKLNPHAQLKGTEPKQEVCTFCHEPTAGSISASSGLRIDPSTQCLGCHPVSPHPMAGVLSSGIYEWMHLAVPSESTARQMSATRARSGERLPIDPKTGKVTCATCHDPHEIGVIAGDPQYLDRARLRPVARCENCHEK